jgi:hypothetical protein
MDHSLHTFKHLTESDLRAIRLHLFGHEELSFEQKETLLDKLLLEELNF